MTAFDDAPGKPRGLVLPLLIQLLKSFHLIPLVSYHSKLKPFYLGIYHSARSVRIRSYSGPHFSPHFPAFGVNIQSECGKMREQWGPE